MTRMTGPGLPPGAEESAAPRWGKQASLIQMGQPAFWLFSALLLFGALVFALEQAAMAGLTTAWLLSWALMLVYAVPVGLLIYRLDLFEREPKSMLAGAILWGGVIATGVVGVRCCFHVSFLPFVSKVVKKWGLAPSRLTQTL